MMKAGVNLKEKDLEINVENLIVWNPQGIDSGMMKAGVNFADRSSQVAPPVAPNDPEASLNLSPFCNDPVLSMMDKIQ